jgi:Na+-driven multidrug efflux pump
LTPQLRNATTVADAYRFFVPLMLMAELMMISHAVVTAFLARMPEPQAVLAAYSVSFYTHAVLGSPIWALQIIVLSFIRDRASVHRLAQFGIAQMVVIAAAQFVLGFTALGDWFFQDVFGTRPEVASQAKLCMVVSALVLPAAIARALSYGLMMLNRRTILVTLGTVVRMIGLAGILAWLTQRYEGAVVGVIALSGCILVETVYAMTLGARFYRRLERRTQAPPTYRELFRFSWPIILMQTAESAMVFTVNFFLGRLVRPELALAAFGVLDSIIRVLLSPLRNLVHTAQTLVRDRADARVVMIFALHMGVLFGLLLLALQVPAVREYVLYRVMGLSTEIAETITPALRIGVLLALVMAGAAVCRGLLIASRHTGYLAISSVLRVAAVALVGALGLLLEIRNGASIGIVALVAAFGAEALLLGARLRRLDRSTSGLFPQPAPATAK